MCPSVMEITQESDESFITKIKMFYEDGKPSKTKYFKESYVFPMRPGKVPVP